MQVVRNFWPESRKDCHLLFLDYRTYREEISAEIHLLYKGHRLIMSGRHNNRTLQTIHDSHISVENIQLKAKESVFWAKIQHTSYRQHCCKVC